MQINNRETRKKLCAKNRTKSIKKSSKEIFFGQKVHVFRGGVDKQSFIGQYVIMC
jgi:hypothetical protein